tara:strand:- start:814 stop:5169 length:4356 start_codon:yes stop_codon:yes gene_type:complete
MNLSKLNIKSLNSKLSHQMPDGSWMSGAKHMQEGGESDEEMMYTKPQESIVTKNKFDYKRVWNPKTNTTSYYTKPSSGKNWKDLQNGKNDRALTSVKATVFKDIPLEEWEQHSEKANWDNQMVSLYKEKRSIEDAVEIDKYKQSINSTLGSANIDYSKYGVRVVQYPYGGTYAKNKMPPGHIEAQLYNKKTGELVTDLGKDADGNAIVSYVNRWNTNAANAPLKPSNWKDKKDVRVSDLELDAKGIQKFIAEAQFFSGTDQDAIDELKKTNPNLYSVLNSYKDLRTTALGTGKKGAYDFASSNCADGVCSALGLDDAKYINAGITDPTEVMDAIRVLPQFKSVIKNKQGTRVSAEKGLSKLIKDGTGYDITGKSAKDISTYLDNLPEGTAEKLGFDADEIYTKYIKNLDAYNARDKAFDNLKKDKSVLSTNYWVATGADVANKLNYAGDVIGGAYDAYQAIPAGTIPTAIDVGANEAADYVVKNSSDWTNNLIDLNQTPAQAWENTKKWWGFEDGGELSKAQYGNGRYSDITSRTGNFNQWNQNDASVRAPIQSAYMPMNLGARGNVAGAIATLGEGAGRLFGGKDKDGDGLMDGAFRDNKAKRKRHKARRQFEKSQNYDYKVTGDPNDPTKYVDSSMNLYNASKKRNPASLQTVNDFNSKLTGDNTFANFDTKTNRYNVGYMDSDFMSKKEKLRPQNSINQLAKLNKKLDPSQQSGVAQLGQNQPLLVLAQDADAFNAADDIPKGTTFGVNADGESTYYAPDAQTEEDKINYYNTMMMKKFGGHMQEGGQPSQEEMAMMQAQQAQAQQPQQAQAPEEGGGDETAQLMEQIKGALEGGAQPQEVMIQLLQAGMQPEAVAQVFIQLGMPEDQIVPAIEQAISQAENQQGAEPSEEEMMAAQEAQAGAPAPPMMQDGGEEEMSMQFEPNPLSRFMAQDGMETEGDLANLPSSPAMNALDSNPELESAQAKYDAAVSRYAEAETNAMAQRKAFGDNARSFGDMNASSSEVGIPSNTAKWIDNSGGFSCNAYSCGNMRQSNMTIPEGEDVVINGRTYSSGDTMPIIPGNAQFNSYAERLGWELQPKGTRPTEVGDLGRGHMYSNSGGGDGSFHSYISAGTGDDDIVDIYNNNGSVSSGYTRMSDGSDLASGDAQYYTDDSGVMRWMGNMPKYQKEMNAAQAELEAIQNKKFGGQKGESAYLANRDRVIKRSMAKAQDGMEMDAAQFAAEENAAAAQQGYPQAQQASEGASRQMNPEDLLGEVVNALTQGAGPEQIYNNILKMGVDEQMASQIIQQAMSIMNQQNADVDADGNLNANYDQGTTDDGYAQMLTQLEEQKNSFKNQYRRDIEQLGLNKKTGGAMQNAQNGTGKVANKFWTREKTSAIFNEFLGQGYSAKEARNNIYNMNVISEKDYDFVKGLGSKNKKLKKGGSADTVELTTQQIAQIMAAGGSVKYV